jgi:hypothetical protein
MSETPIENHNNIQNQAGSAGRVAEMFRRVLQWLPPKARLAVFFGLLVLVPLAVYSYLSNGRGDLNLVCRHNLQSAQLTVSVDGKIVFSDQSSGTVKKRFGFLDKKVEGALSKALSIPLGKHTVRVSLKAPSEQFDQTRQIAVNVVSGKESTLTITTQRGDLSLAYEGPPAFSNSVSAPEESSAIWSILMTVMGAVGSAAIGFMVQEFLRSRKAAFLQNKSSRVVR